MPQKHRPVKFCCQCGDAAHYKCAGCSYGSRARYCCRVCQKVDWGRHQETCPRDDTTVACKIYEEDITVAELATMTRLVASTVCHRSSGPCVQQEVVFRRQIDTLWTEIKNRVPAGYRGLQPIAEWDVMNFNKNKKWADDHVNQRKANANLAKWVQGCMGVWTDQQFMCTRTLVPCPAAGRIHRPRFAHPAQKRTLRSGASCTVRDSRLPAQKRSSPGAPPGNSWSDTRIAISAKWWFLERERS